MTGFYRIKIVLALFSICIGAQARSDEFKATSLPVVQIHSMNCGNKTEEFLGSGLLFTYDGHYYVVTSEHVIMQPYLEAGCNRIQFANGKSVPAEQLVSDWSKDLAILSVPSLGSQKHPIDPELKIPAWDMTGVSQGLAIGQTLRIAGFPASSAIPVFTKGTIEALDSLDHYFPAITSLIRIGHSDGEYGMSGSPVYNEEGSDWVGILSSQVHILLPGDRPATIEVDASFRQTENIVFAISKEQVNEFIQDVLVKKILSPKMLRLSRSGDAERVQVGELEFSIERPLSTGAVLDAQRARSYTGVNDPVGHKSIAGVNDPVGHIFQAGGSGTRYTDATVTIKLADSVNKTTPFVLTNKEWFQNLPLQIVAHGPVQVSKIAGIDTKNRLVTENDVLILKQFFYLIRDEQNIPLFPRGKTVVNSIRLQGDLDRIQGAITDLRAHEACSASADCMKYIEGAAWYLELIQKYDFQLMTADFADYLDAITNKENPTLQFLYLKARVAAVDLIQGFYSLQETLRQK